MLKLKNIVKEYSAGDAKVVALKGVNIEFRKNEFVSILGPSGCGKTTTLRLIAGFLEPDEGEILFEDKSRCPGICHSAYTLYIIMPEHRQNVHCKQTPVRCRTSEYCPLCIGKTGSVACADVIHSNTSQLKN